MLIVIDGFSKPGSETLLSRLQPFGFATAYRLTRNRYFAVHGLARPGDSTERIWLHRDHEHREAQGSHDERDHGQGVFHHPAHQFQRSSHSGLFEPRGTSTVLKEAGVRDRSFSVIP